MDRAVNIASRLQQREIGKVGRLMESYSPIPFRNLALQAEYLPHPDYYRAASRVADIVIVEDIIFVHVYESRKIICTLNGPDEYIKRVIYNELSESLVITSADDDDSNNRHYRSIRIKDIRMGVIDGSPLFDAEPRPITADFDFRNGKIYAYYHGLYQVLDITSYEILFSVHIEVENLLNFVYRNHGFLSIMHQSEYELEVNIVSTEDGTLVRSIHLLGEDLEFNEHYDNKILFKEEDEDLQIYDMRTNEVTEVANFTNPGSTAFLHDKREFVTFTERTVQVWSIKGECLRDTLDDHQLFYEDDSKASYITQDQEHVISYCMDCDSRRGEREPKQVGSINISCLKTGRCLARITSAETRSNITSTAAEALDKVTFVFYDAGRHEIYTGTDHGRVHMWSN